MKARDRESSALIFKVNQLGDNVVFLPVVQRLAAERTFEKLALWTTPLAAPLYRGLPIDLELSTRGDFYPAWKRPLQLLKLSRQARIHRAKIALIAEDMGNTAYFLALVSGARKRIGSKPPYLKIPFAVTNDLRLPFELPEAEKSWRLGSALAEAAGREPWPGRPPAPNLSHLCSMPAKAYDILIHPGASQAYKRWPISRYTELATRLSRDFRVGWCHAPEAPAPDGSRFEIIRHQTLDEFVSHLSKASLFIGNNSGPMNLASALGIPSLIFNGPSGRSWNPYWHADRFRLLRDETLPCIGCSTSGSRKALEICLNRKSPLACMNYWTVDTVEFEVKRWLEKWASIRR